MSKKQQKGHRRKSPQGGWGMGSKEPIQKLFFIHSGYNIRELIQFILILIRIEIKSLQSAKIKSFSQMGDPWGELNAPEATSEQKLPLFLSNLLKKSKHIRLKYSQKHSESTFGSAHF